MRSVVLWAGLLVVDGSGSGGGGDGDGDGREGTRTESCVNGTHRRRRDRAAVLLDGDSGVYRS